MGNYSVHKFFCMNCGKESIPLARKTGHQHGRMHRKKLYCPWCKETVNAIECKSDEDVTEFKEAFERGDYKDEVEESLLASRSTWLW